MVILRREPMVEPDTPDTLAMPGMLDILDILDILDTVAAIPQSGHGELKPYQLSVP
jgi:hypothetical protein